MMSFGDTIEGLIDEKTCMECALKDCRNRGYVNITLMDDLGQPWSELKDLPVPMCTDHVLEVLEAIADGETVVLEKENRDV